jgi:hypothetical protein
MCRYKSRLSSRVVAATPPPSPTRRDQLAGAYHRTWHGTRKTKLSWTCHSAKHATRNAGGTRQHACANPLKAPRRSRARTAQAGQKYAYARTRAATVHSRTLSISHTLDTNKTTMSPHTRASKQKTRRCNVYKHTHTHTHTHTRTVSHTDARAPELGTASHAQNKGVLDVPRRQNTTHDTRHAGADNMLVQPLKAPRP